MEIKTPCVSILILLDYLFLSGKWRTDRVPFQREGLNPYFIGLPILIMRTVSWEDKLLKHQSQSLFYWITYSYTYKDIYKEIEKNVSILILLDYLFLYICCWCIPLLHHSLNPYFIGLPILILLYFRLLGCRQSKSQSLFYWITYSYHWLCLSRYLDKIQCLNPYFIGLPILILGENYYSQMPKYCLNPYFIGLPILIATSLI